jgi:histidine triad (HIT) family protein
VFCEIVADRAPATIVQKWDDALAIVPLSPVVDGHTLIIPRRHVVDFTDVPMTSASMMLRAAEFASDRGWEHANMLTSKGRAATQSVFHLHLHVVPRAEDDQLMLPWGTVYGEDPAAPHWCRVAQELHDALTEFKAAPVE